jgi:hypothetical protein
VSVRTGVSELLLLALFAANFVIAVAELLAFTTLAGMLAWSGSLRSTHLVMYGAGVLLPAAHFACFYRLVGSGIGTLRKISLLGLLPLTSLTLFALVLVGWP